MATTYPASKQSFNNPSSGSKLNDALVIHSEQHATINDTVEAIQDIIGYDGGGTVQTLIARIAAKMDKITGVQAGDILVGNASGGFDRVVKPAASRVWGTDASGALGYKPDPTGGAFDPLAWTGWGAKGQILAATGNDAAAVVGVGSNNTVLIADSSQPAGVRWGTQAPVGGTGNLAWVAVNVAAGYNKTQIDTAIGNAGVRGTVYFPPGTYTLSGNIQPQQGQTWILDPNTKLVGATGTETIYIPSSATDVTIIGGRVDGTANSGTFRGSVHISGDRAHVQDMEVFGGVVNILVRSADHVKVEHCRCYDDRTAGIWCEGGGSAPSLNPAILYNYVTSTGSHSGIHVKGSGAQAPTGEQSRRARIIGNFVERPSTDLSGSSSCLGIEIWGGAHYATIAGNTLRYTRYAISVDNSNHVTVTGNTIIECMIGIEFASSSYCTATGNTVDCGTAYQAISSSIGISCSNARNSNNTLTGNTLVNFTSCGITLNGSGGDGAPFYIISANMFETADNCPCIKLQQARHVVINANMFVGDNSTGTDGDTSGRCDAIWINSSNTDQIQVEGVAISGNYAWGIDRFLIFQASNSATWPATSTTPYTDRIALTGNVFTNVGSVWPRPSSGKVDGVYIGDNCKSIGNIGYTDYRHVRAGTTY